MPIVTFENANITTDQLIVTFGDILELRWDSTLKLPFLAVVSTLVGSCDILYSGVIIGSYPTIWPSFIGNVVREANGTLYPTLDNGNEINCSQYLLDNHGMTVKINRLVASVIGGGSITASCSLHLLQLDTITRLVCSYEFEEY